MSDAINRAPKILQALLQKFDKELRDTFVQQNVFGEVMAENAEALPERRIEGKLIRESMGVWSPLYSPGARYTWATRGQVAPFEIGLGRGVITFLVPITEMEAIISSPPESRKLDNFYETNIKGTVRRWNYERFEHFLTGTVSSPQVATASTAYNMYVSLSPDFSSGVTRGGENGIMSAAAYTAQSTTTLNLAKSSTYDWATQYYDIASSWGINGVSQWMRLNGDQRLYGDDPMGNSTQFIGLTDSASWYNITSFFLNRGTYFMAGAAKNAAETTPQNGMLMPGNVMLYMAQQLKTSSFSTAALTAGVTYVLNPSRLRRFYNPNAPLNFTGVKWERDPLSDNMRAIVTVDEQFTPWGTLAEHGLLSGTAR